MNRGRQRAQGADGSDVEDASLPLANHLFVDRLGDGEEAAHVRIDDFVPGAVGGGGKVIAAIDGRVVDEDIDAAPRLRRVRAPAASCPSRSVTETLKRERLASVSLNLAARLVRPDRRANHS